MNTRKQVLLMSILLFGTMVILGIYAAWYPTRATNAEIEFANKTAERAAILFARNCRLCHGDLGEGGFAGARLPAAPALNRLELQAMVEIGVQVAENATPRTNRIVVDNVGRIAPGATILIGDERMQVTGINGNALTVRRGWDHTQPTSHFSGAAVRLQDTDELNEQVEMLTNTISCGRVGTSMPAWAQEHGGPLSPEQVRQLVVLITKNRWDLVVHEVEHEDETNQVLPTAISANVRSIQLNDVGAFSVGEVIRIGTERMRITSVPTLAADDPDRSGVVSVERGVLQSAPQDHAAGAKIWRFPEAPDEPAILQRSCGQIAVARGPAAEPTTIPDPFDGQTVEVVAQGIQFNTSEIRVQAGGRLRLRLDNRDNGVPHNIAVRRSATDSTPVATGSVGLIFNGPGVHDIAFEIPAPGTYFFVCDAHPTQMTGTFIVQ